jgi:hypothetical protein
LATHEAKAVEKFALSRTDLLKRMDHIYQMATAAIPVLDNKGVPVGEYRTNLAVAESATKALGEELYGMFVAKSQGVPVDPRDAWTDEEVRGILKMLKEHQRGLEHAGTSTTTGGADRAMAPVGELDGAENA